MEDHNKEPEKAVKAKPGPKPKAKPQAEKIIIKDGLKSKDGLWEVESKRDDLWIIVPTEVNTKAHGRFPVTKEKLLAMFG